MGHKTIFDYAKMAAQAEQRVLQLLDCALHDRVIEDRSAMDLRKTAQPRQGQESSG